MFNTKNIQKICKLCEYNPEKIGDFILKNIMHYEVKRYRQWGSNSVYIYKNNKIVFWEDNGNNYEE